jgi:transcriptional regulatory protein LevR
MSNNKTQNHRSHELNTQNKTYTSIIENNMKSIERTYKLKNNKKEYMYMKEDKK